MRAVVIGGNGFIGSHLLDALLENGWHVVVYDRVLERYRPQLADVEYVLGNLEDLQILAPVLALSLIHISEPTRPY